jgi:hypothetical protein
MMMMVVIMMMMMTMMTTQRTDLADLDEAGVGEDGLDDGVIALLLLRRRLLVRLRTLQVIRISP